MSTFIELFKADLNTIVYFLQIRFLLNRVTDISDNMIFLLAYITQERKANFNLTIYRLKDKP